MAVAAFKSTTQRQWDIRGVEIEISPVSSSRNESPPRRSMSRNPSPTRRSMSRASSPTRRSRGPVRRSLSKAPSPTPGRRERGVSREPVRRSLSKAPSPTRGRRGVSREPVRRSVSRQPSPSRRAVSRAPSPTRGRRGVSRGLSPTRGRRAVSRGPSPTRGRASPATPGGRATTRATSPSRRMSSVGPRSRATSLVRQQQPVTKPSGHVLRKTQSSADMALSQFLVDAAVNVGSPLAVIVTRQSGIGLRGSPRVLPSDSESEVEPRYARRLDRSFSSRRDSSDNESVQSSRSASRRMSGLRAGGGSLRQTSTAGERTPHELRRSVTNLDISDAATPVYYQKSNPGDDHRLVEKDNGEAQGDKNIEEKTI